MTGQQLIDKWAAWIRQWIVMTPEQSLVCAVWAMHTWIYEQFAATPYLSITATTKRSGKTSLLVALGMLSRNGKQQATIMTKTIVRMIAGYEGRVTFFLDEAEKLSAGRLDDTRTMLATGYQRGASHAVSSGKGFDEFPTYAPKCFATIGDIQDVLRDRSIVLDLGRGAPPKSLTLYRSQAEQEAAELVGEFLDWWKHANVKRIPIVDPVWLTSARDREIWTPLFSLATLLQLGKREMDLLVGFSVDNANMKQLPARRYHSAQDETDAEERTMSERALHDLMAAFKDDETFLPSREAVDRMRAVATAPWRTWRGAGLSEVLLAALVTRYGVQTVQKRIGKRAENTRAMCYTRVSVATAISAIK
jgi:hypothetical protein